METVIHVISAYSKLPSDHLYGLVALAALFVAGYAIYVVFSIVRERHK